MTSPRPSSCFVRAENVGFALQSCVWRWGGGECPFPRVVVCLKILHDCAACEGETCFFLEKRVSWMFVGKHAGRDYKWEGGREGKGEGKSTYHDSHRTPQARSRRP